MRFVFGVGGTIFQQTMRDPGKLGVESTAAACKATLKDIHWWHLQLIEVAATIIVQRRVMDSQKLFGSTTRPP